VRREREKRLAERLAIDAPTTLRRFGGISREVVMCRVRAQSMPPSCVRRNENPLLCNEA